MRGIVAKMAINFSQTLGRWVIPIKMIISYDSPTRSNSLLVNNVFPNAKRAISRNFNALQILSALEILLQTAQLLCFISLVIL